MKTYEQEEGGNAMRSIIVIETVRRSGFLKGKVVMENDEEHPFILDPETGDYHVEDDSSNLVDWPFIMKRLLPNQKVEQS